MWAARFCPPGQGLPHFEARLLASTIQSERNKKDGYTDRDVPGHSCRPLPRPLPCQRVEWISPACTFLLIFAMGSLLGQRENFWQELSQLGVSSALFFAIPTLLSIVIVFFLTKGWRNRQPDSPERMGK